MASKLKMIPLGGLNEIGKNLTVYEYGKDIILVDCGMGFPDDDMYGVDVVIPDVSYLVENRKRIRGLVLTHGHEDHIGAIPYVLDKLGFPPIYSTPLTQGLVELKLQEKGLLNRAKLYTVLPGDIINLGNMSVEFIHVNHSIADSVALCIRTPIGCVIHTGDFKIDVTPVQGEITDLTRFGELGREGVLALAIDSTNVEKAGFSESESRVADRFDELFRGCDKRMIVTTFASNVHRLDQLLKLAQKYKRRVGITGRSMENVVKISQKLGYMDVAEDVIMDMKQLMKLPPQKQLIICTGSQGENMSALYRMAFGEHKQVDVGSGDRIIVSASAIPGNETTITKIIDELMGKGAEVIYERGTDLHVTGHACQEELKLIYALTKPRYFIPIHGERHMLHKHAAVARSMGHNERELCIAENGSCIEMTQKTLKLGESVPAGKILVDGMGIGEVGSVVLRERKLLADEGMLLVILTLSAQDGALVTGPEIISRGFVYEKESAELFEELCRVTLESLDYCSAHRIADVQGIKGKIKSNLAGYLYKTTKRSPMILPVVLTV